jgi:hypothetical protein
MSRELPGYDEWLAREPEEIPLDEEATSGPFETEREASDAALERGGPPEDGWAILSAKQNLAMLLGACADAGITVGAYDSRILHWLSGFEHATCAVIAGLITRAHESRT